MLSFIQVGALLLWIMLMVLISTEHPRKFEKKGPNTASIEKYRDSYVFYESPSNDEDGPAKYYHEFLEQFVHVETSSNVTKDLIKRAEDNKYDYWHRYRVAANFTDAETITALFSSYEWATSAIVSLNLISNALLQYSTGNRNTSITVIDDYIERTVSSTIALINNLEFIQFFKHYMTLYYVK